MKLFSYLQNGKHGVGCEFENSTQRGLAEHDPGYPGTLLHLLKGAPRTLAQLEAVMRAAPVVDTAAIEFLPPLWPPKILCAGLNYVEHTAESPYKQPQFPTVFGRFTSSLVAHRGGIVRPFLSDTLDYEGEMAVVIGRSGRHIPRHSALSHVAGYSVFNDCTVRGYARKTTQWTLGKNFDRTGAFGPYFVTADALPSGGANLRIATRLNGRTVQEASTADMIFDVATLISFISEAITLEVGDLIVTGTPSGIGAAQRPPVYLQGGDVCEVEIEGIGTLSNPVVNEVEGSLEGTRLP